MGRGGGVQLRIKLHLARASGLAQRVQAIEHAELDVVGVLRPNAIDARNR